MWERIKRWRWAIIVTALLVLGIGYSLWPEDVLVDTAKVSRGTMMIGVTDDGVTRVRDLYTVSAPVTGYVTRIELDPGDRVTANQTVIARMAALPAVPLDTRTRAELQNAVRASVAAEAAAAAELRLARSDLNRAEQLSKRGFLPRAQLDAARANAQSRDAEVQRSRAETRRLRASLTAPPNSTPRGGKIAVRSPESGVVLRRLNESEGTIEQGTPLMEIGDPARIEIVLDLLSREAARVQPGAEVLITRWGGEQTLTGRVSRVEPFGRLKISALGIEEQRVDVIVEFDAATSRRIATLGHGYQVEGTVVLWRNPQALRVPVGALFRGTEGKWRVFAAEGGEAQLRNVRIGRLNDEYGEVLEGLEAGNEIILNPGTAIDDGVGIAQR